MVAGGKKISSRPIIPEEFLLHLGEFRGSVEPFLLLRGAMQRQESIDEKGVVVKIRVQFGFARRVGVQQTALRRAQMGEHCLGGLSCAVKVLRVAKQSAGVPQIASRRDR